MDTATLIAALRRPDAYAHPVADVVELVQTHISLLFFAGDFVYKVKKAVDMGFLDFRSLADRKHFCEEELRLNRRLAPEIYLGVVPVTQDDNGRIRIDGDGAPIDFAVRMTRLPPSGMLTERLRHGVIDNDQLNRIADLMAAFHARCPTGPGVDEHASPASLAAQIDVNFSELARFASPADGAADSGLRTMSKARSEFLRASARGFLRDEETLLNRRVSSGRIREGHGDLHADNVCFMDDRVVVYDCIEFSERLRCRDVAAEIAFLAMDLDSRGYRGFARYLVRRYADRARDEEMPRLIPFYKLHFAAVRGKIASIRALAAPPETPERDAARREAARYFDLAATYALPPCLILMCGLPASGKSIAAHVIARPFEAIVLRSDVVRKELARVEPTRSAAGGPEEGIYTPEFTERTYEALLDRAEVILTDGRTVVLDATISTASMRRRFLDLARARGAAAIVVWMWCDEETTRRRLAARAQDASEVSDADWSIYEHARGLFEAPDAASDEPLVRFEGDCDDAILTEKVIDALIPVSP